MYNSPLHDNALKETVLITGAGGFLARNLRAALIEAGYTNILTLGRKPLESTETDYGLHFTDIKLLKAGFEQIDIIFHLASFVPYGRFHLPDPEFYLSNILLTGELVSLYPEARFVFASSVSVFGQPLYLPISISHPFNNPDYYGLSKIAGEVIVRNHRNYAVIRFSSIVGKGMRPVSMLPKMVQQAKGNGIINIWGSGERRQNYIDVQDAVRLCMRCGTSAMCIATLGVGARAYSNLAVAEYIASLTGADIEFSGVDHSPSFEYDAEKEYELLGYSPEITLEQTITSMLV
ncbi:NAD(P)-dependent oxidoreductase [Parasegetibacter sp. NRK P23]|uniref:NAD-dependent epimerase/dehydratase family protein n=1 Tax=Parasegetibacter sp. NRK P23 TaxID=2942999 RepID=UPI002044BB69|nr:NAD(P)-dependent oxidoreductase [Parasegetibacter sp. NRK P23]MCM5527639.1 NAD(P)-dependent oxidoreductase [Parasegetibacter sp. NRK P23]